MLARIVDELEDQNRDRNRDKHANDTEEFEARDDRQDDDEHRHADRAVQDVRLKEVRVDVVQNSVEDEDINRKLKAAAEIRQDDRRCECECRSKRYELEHERES